MFISNPSQHPDVDIAEVMEQARRCLECGEPWPCVSACPHGADIQAAMRFLAEGAVVSPPSPEGALDAAVGDAFARDGIDRSFR